MLVNKIISSKLYEIMSCLTKKKKKKKKKNHFLKLF